LGVNPGTLSRWHKRGCPLEPEAAARWREQHAGVRVKPGAAAGNDAPAKVESFSAWRVRREAALAQQAEIDLAERCGQLVRVDHVDEMVTWACAVAKDLLLGLPARVAPAVPGLSADEVRALLDDEVRYALDQLADGLFRARVAPTPKGKSNA
jgi:hypothetical protein